jgi:hypothetical protein
MRRRSLRSSPTEAEVPLQSFPSPITVSSSRLLKRKSIQSPKDISNGIKSDVISETDNSTFCTDQDAQIEEPKLKKRKMNEIDKEEYVPTINIAIPHFDCRPTEFTPSPEAPYNPFFSGPGLLCAPSLQIDKHSSPKSFGEQDVHPAPTAVSSSFSLFVSSVPTPTNITPFALIQLPVAQQLDYIVHCLRTTFDFDLELTTQTLRSFNKHWNSLTYKPQISSDSSFQHEEVITWLFSRCATNLGDVPNNALLIQFKIQAFQMLGLLARNDRSRDLIVRKGGLNLILSELRKKPAIGIFKKVCLTIGNIFNSPMTQEAEVQEMVEREGIVESIITTMKHHTDKPELIKQACFALGNLAFTGDFEPIVVKERGIEIVLEAIRKHGARHPFLLVEACFFLKNLCFGEKGRSILMQSGGIPLIIGAVRDHPNCVELLDLAFNIFYDITFTKGAEVEIVEHDGISLMIDALRRYVNAKDALPVLHEAIRALGRLYCICDDSVRLKMVRSGAITAILDALNVHSDDFELRQRACWSFYRMSKEKIELRYEQTPDCAVPSLKELTARRILQSPSSSSSSSLSLSSPTTNFSMEQKPPATSTFSLAAGINMLALELAHYLTRECRCCSHCGAPFFEHHYELLQFRQFREHIAELPVFLQLCSRHCFQQVKNK